MNNVFVWIDCNVSLFLLLVKMVGLLVVMSLSFFLKNGKWMISQNKNCQLKSS